MNGSRILSAVVFAFVMSSSAVAEFDGFNRTELGNRWEVVEPGLHIVNKKLRGVEYSVGRFLPAREDNSASMVVRLRDKELGFGAIIIGDTGSPPHAFVKVQSQNDEGTFSHAAFYDERFGVGHFFPLDSDVESYDKLLMTVTMVGKTATLELDLDMDGTPEYVYSYHYGERFGSQVGVGVRGAASVNKLNTSKVKRSPPLPTHALPASLGVEADLLR